MRDKIKRMRSKIYNTKYDKEFLEEIKDIPTYDLFTPNKSTVLCEEEEITDPSRVKFVEHKESSNYDVVVFLLFLENDYDVKEVKPVKLYLKYKVEDPELPHYPGEEYQVDVHKSEIIVSFSDLKKYNIHPNDLNGVSESDFPAIKLRTTVKKN